jgi:glyoxylase-like metal-dependent hydrolase (beta-lactamase superfamily II)
MSAKISPEIRGYFHDGTNTISYLVWNPQTMHGAIVDPVLDFDHKSGKADTHSTDAILQEADDLGVTLEWVLETHVHADHLTSSRYIKMKTGAQVGLGGARKRSSARRHDTGRFRQDAHRARCRPVHAAPAPAVDPGQHPRR